MSTFATEKMKELVSFAIRGAGFNKLIELSCYMGVRVENGMLYLNTTDGTNYLCVSDSCVADDFDVTVNAELFAKLISKITSDVVDMSVVGNSLVVDGNGKYTLEIVPDETGNKLSFPDKFPTEVNDIGTINAVDVVAINTTVKASLDSNVVSVYSSYYLGDVVASTDRCMMTVFNKKVFDNPYMFNRAFVDLMTMSGADVAVSASSDMLLAESSISEKGLISVCTKIPDNVTDFKIADVKKFAGLEVKSFCRIRKAQLLDLLDRLSLFVTKFDDGAIQLEFTKTGVNVSSLASSGVEFIEYVECKDAEEMTIKININRLLTELKSYSSDVVDLYYGNSLCIKLVDGDMTQIIALIQ